MKNVNLNALVAIVVTALFLSGCGLGKMVKKYPTVQYKVVPEVLEVHGGKIPVTVNGTFPTKYFHKKATVNFTPVLKYEGGETTLKPYTLIGEAVEGEGQKIGYATGGSFTYTDTVPYKAAMKKCELIVNVGAALGKKSADLIAGQKLADGVITTSERVRDDENVMVGADKYEKETIITQIGELYFPIQQAVISGREKGNKSMRELKRFAKLGNPTKSIEITAWASPDGPVDLNDRLSKNRTNNTFKYVKSELKRLKLDGANNDDIYTKTSKGEYWDGFQQLVGASDLEDKQLILDIVSRHSDADKREQEIKNLAVIYLTLAKDILPKLRKAQIVINSLEPKKTDAEIDSLAIADPDTLNAEELLYAATLTDDLNKKMKIYESYTKVYPDDWRGYNNIAYIHIMQGNFDDALAALGKAEGKKKAAEVLNNMGVIAVRNEDYTQAQTHFEDAKSNGADESNNLGILNIRTGNYEMALEYFGTNCSYNAALAELLTGNTEEAVQKLDCAEKTAAADYLSAIIGARTNNTEMMVSNLKKAIGTDASYRREAMTDLEFAKFWDSSDFKNAIQ